MVSDRLTSDDFLDAGGTATKRRSDESRRGSFFGNLEFFLSRIQSVVYFDQQTGAVHAVQQSKSSF